MTSIDLEIQDTCALLASDILDESEREDEIAALDLLLSIKEAGLE